LEHAIAFWNFPLAPPGVSLVFSPAATDPDIEILWHSNLGPRAQLLSLWPRYRAVARVAYDTQLGRRVILMHDGVPWTSTVQQVEDEAVGNNLALAFAHELGHFATERGHETENPHSVMWRSLHPLPVPLTCEVP
jgi:hypothetical protein